MASASPYAFRNRITVHATQGKIGFFAKNSREIVDVERCAIAIPPVNDALKELRATGLADGKHRTLRGAGVPRTFTQTNDFVAGAVLEFVAGQVIGETADRRLLRFRFFRARPGRTTEDGHRHRLERVGDQSRARRGGFERNLHLR